MNKPQITLKVFRTEFDIWWYWKKHQKWFYLYWKQQGIRHGGRDFKPRYIIKLDWWRAMPYGKAIHSLSHRIRKRLNKNYREKLLQRERIKTLERTNELLLSKIAQVLEVDVEKIKKSSVLEILNRLDKHE